MSEPRTPAAIPRERALVLVTLSYVMALAAGWATILLAPIDDPLLLTLAADAVATVVIFGWSVAYDNSSFYDAYWSVIPVAIVLYWMSLADASVPALRTTGILLVVTVWGARLTWNWARGWTGLDHEDWRYVGFRDQFPRAYWAVSFGGVHFFPTLIVFAGMAAVYPALIASGRPLGWIDLLAFAVGLGGIAFEWIADEQLRAFVQGPKQPGQTLRTGLWRYSRHPNYLGEMMIWWSLFLFGLAADPDWAKWGVLAPLAMSGMFLFVSIPLLEKRSLERRSNYQQVIDETSMLIPLPPRTPRISGTPE
jgi:steroid 5-alpha reductase family enzyme